MHNTGSPKTDALSQSRQPERPGVILLRFVVVLAVATLALTAIWRP